MNYDQKPNMNFEAKIRRDELKRWEDTIVKLIMYIDLGKLKLAMRSEQDMNAFACEICPSQMQTPSLKYTQLTRARIQLYSLLKKGFQSELLVSVFNAMLTMLECKSEVNKRKLSKLSIQYMETLGASHWANDDGDKPHPWYHWVNIIVSAVLN